MTKRSRLGDADIQPGKLYYLASPYSDENALIRQFRYDLVNLAAAELMKCGVSCIEPIASSHHKAATYELPKGYTFWKDRDRLFISKCDGVIVLCISGWKQSEGVTDEIAHAKELGIPVIYLDPKSVFKASDIVRAMNFEAE
jgi:Domain of unknown function (DUF1937)